MLKDQVLEHLWKAQDAYISGAELAGRLGVSRTAVWKAMGQLRAQGFDATAASRVDELDLVEDYPPPPELGLPAGFARRPPAVSAAPASAPLLPPSVADAAPPRPVARPPDDGDEVRTLLRRELLEIPESLKETEKESMP